MMRRLSVVNIILVHQKLIDQTGGREIKPLIYIFW